MRIPPTYGVLLVSFSRHGHQRNFVPLYQAHPRTRIVAVADDDGDIDGGLRGLNRRWAADLGLPYVPSVDEALGRADVDVVSIGHEIERRADLAQRAAAAGKHLWIDKYLGATIDECDRVVNAVENAGVRAIVPSYHYGSLVRQTLAVLRTGAVGDLLGVHVDVMFSKGWPRAIGEADRRPFLPAGRWKFPAFKRELLTVGAYAVGLVQACLGAPIAAVAGHGGAFYFPEHARAGAEDFATLTLTDLEGRTASICGGRIGVATHPGGGPSQAVLVGTSGSLRIDAKFPAADVFLRADLVGALHRPERSDPMQWASGPPTLSVPLSPDTAGLAAGLDDLVAALDEDRPPVYSVAEARDNMEVLLAGYESIAGGGLLVELPLPRTGAR